MNWFSLEDISTLESIIDSSNVTPIAIFKHSTRCSISIMAKDRFERKWNNANTIKVYYLDLLAHRDVSNAIAEKLNIEHQSPQVLLVSHKKCIYYANHTLINADELAAQKL